jgi:hypothetical protein
MGTSASIHRHKTYVIGSSFFSLHMQHTHTDTCSLLSQEDDINEVGKKIPLLVHWSLPCMKNYILLLKTF